MTSMKNNAQRLTQRVVIVGGAAQAFQSHKLPWQNYNRFMVDMRGHGEFAL